MNDDASIMIHHGINNEISNASIHIDHFQIASYKVVTIYLIKADLSKKYNVKDLSKTEKIISWQMIQNINSWKSSILITFVIDLKKKTC